ncbi:transglutaminase domain-containing protein [Actinoplanes sp. NPDC023801]|uniref:transglutaminase domain-containing protein n=1 Tax=Actinoplanes sp. NPDC023801 TaxID=3154595 RepID=UPI0033EFF2E1
MTGTIDYAAPGPLTTIGSHLEPALADLPGDPAGICRAVHDLVIQPADAAKLGLPEHRFASNQLRPADDIITALLAVDPAPLTVPRQPEQRVVGTCRHFALLSCALMRHRGIEARTRCGFGTYFQPGQGRDHWITEYRHDGRWVRIDTEILGSNLVKQPEDLAVGEFLTGGEAWTAHRAGTIDAATFGVHGTENFGSAEIRGNAIRDLAALQKIEMLPWDEWGRMAASYRYETGPDYDALIDTIAATCATGDPAALAALYASEDLPVPTDLVR